MSSVRSYGAQAASAGNVANPTDLVPGLPATRVNDDILICLTSCRSATPTVSTPSGWTLLWNLTTGSNGRLVGFGRVVDGSESAPTVTWSGLTTGTSGTPVLARIAAVVGLDHTNLATLVDVSGTATTTTSSTAAAGGDAVTTTVANACVMVMSVRQDDAGVWATLGASDGVTWATVTPTSTTTSGADLAQEWQFGDKASAGSVAAKTFTLTGAVSAISVGVMVALKPAAVVPVNPRRPLTRLQATTRAAAY